MYKFGLDVKNGQKSPALTGSRVQNAVVSNERVNSSGILRFQVDRIIYQQMAVAGPFAYRVALAQAPNKDPFPGALKGRQTNTQAPSLDG